MCLVKWFPLFLRWTPTNVLRTRDLPFLPLRIGKLLKSTSEASLMEVAWSHVHCPRERYKTDGYFAWVGHHIALLHARMRPAALWVCAPIRLSAQVSLHLPLTSIDCLPCPQEVCASFKESEIFAGDLLEAPNSWWGRRFRTSIIYSFNSR